MATVQLIIDINVHWKKFKVQVKAPTHGQPEIFPQRINHTLNARLLILTESLNQVEVYLIVGRPAAKELIVASASGDKRRR